MHIRPLHPHLGAEILDFDPLAPTPPDQIEALVDAFDHYQLLLVRGARAIPPERQVEIAGWFGQVVSNSDSGALWSVLRNEEAAGSIRLPFHSDFSYTDFPIKGISLHALDVPDGGSATAFASGIHAWETLSPDVQARCAPLTLRHLYESMIDTKWPRLAADHPLRLIHPRTGRPILYLTELHAERLLQLPREESDALIAELTAHLYAPDHIYTHRWQRHDLLIWDNLAVQHARPERAAPEEGRRALQRVALNDLGLPEILDRVRKRETETA
ncbi:MAG: TauD/TfdA family dioxygenase [Sphingobium sp.]